MPRTQVFCVCKPHRSHHLADTALGVAVEIVHPLRLVSRYKSFHEHGIGRRHTYGAFVGVALLRLNAANRHHHAASGVAEIGSQCEAFDDVESRGDFSTANDADAVPKIAAHQRVVDENQGFDQRGANRVGELQWCCTGSPLTPIHSDEIRSHDRFEHRFADRQKFAALAYAELEADRFAVGQLPELSDKLNQAFGR